MSPFLAREIPSVANGALTVDGKRVTWRLRDGLKWSDGSPVTSNDFKATWQYAIKKENATSTVSDYSAIASVDTPGATTIMYRLLANQETVPLLGM